MPDRKKVIKGLEQTAARLQYGSLDNVTLGECEDAVFDALALLREQEPVLVEHKKVDDGYQAIEDDFVCKHCGAWWMIPEQDLKYCPGCGRAVKWDDAE